MRNSVLKQVVDSTYYIKLRNIFKPAIEVYLASAENNSGKKNAGTKSTWTKSCRKWLEVKGLLLVKGRI